MKRKHLSCAATLVVVLALFAALIWGISRVSWSGTQDSLGLKPSPARFAKKYREDPEKAMLQYSLRTDIQDKSYWDEWLRDIVDGAEILGEEYVVTLAPKDDSSQKVELYIVIYRHKGEKKYVGISVHVSKNRKFTPTMFEGAHPSASARIAELMARE